MSVINFSSLRPAREPTRKERALYQRWIAYLKDSRLSEDEIHRRAADFTAKKKQVPTE